jgi:hypothetical protein
MPAPSNNRAASGAAHRAPVSNLDLIAGVCLEEAKLI